MKRIFQFLPSEEILADQLVPGDIYYSWNRWSLVIEFPLVLNDMRQENNLQVKCIDGGASYLMKKEKVKIIKRGLIDRVGLYEVIKKHVQESEEAQRLSDELDEDELD